MLIICVMAIDKIDSHILAVLQEEGRISNADLAQRVGLSDSAASRRVRQLEEAGYIDRYVALLDAEKLGLGITAYVQVNLKDQTEALTEAFKAAASRDPEVVSCYVTSGNYDLLLKVVSADMKAYSEFTLHRLQNMPGVQNISSNFVLEVIKLSTAVPIPQS